MRLLITEDFPPKEGGLQTWAFELARNLHRQAGAMTVMARRATPVNRAFDRQLPFPVWRMGGHDWNRYRDLYVAYYLGKFLFTRGVKPIVYATHWKVGFVPAVVAPLIGMKVIIGAHGMEVLKERKPSRQRLIRLAFSRAHRGLAVSEYTRQALIRLGVPKDKVAVIPNGVDVELFRPRERSTSLVQRYDLQGKKVILTLARLVARKGQDQVIRALPEVIEKVPSAVYLLVGQGPDESRLRDLVDSLGLSEQVIFAGYVPDEQLVDHYSLADLYIMASREIAAGGDVEGFGITFLEAGACGLPVIGGRSGGVPDAVLEGQTGLLVDPEDSGEIAGALIRILSDEDLARKMGERGRRRAVQAFQWRHMAERCLRLEDEHP
jgi:phosphatidylinositol alpha-1,6-mannosyltransferase